jgi:hypothetical protein
VKLDGNSLKWAISENQGGNDWNIWKDKFLDFWNNNLSLNKIPNFLDLLEKGLEKELTSRTRGGR